MDALDIAGLMECVDQGALVVRLERNVEVDRGLGERRTTTLSVGRDGPSLMLYT